MTAPGENWVTVDRTALSGVPDPGCGQGAAARLAHREGAGAAVHARATASRRDARATGDRARRDLDQEGPHLPHRGQRPDPPPPDLVWRHGSLRGKPGSVLREARPAESRAAPTRGDG